MQAYASSSKKPRLELAGLFMLLILNGVDGTRTRDLLRDRQAF
jgi:hypothetical protein